MGRPPGQFPSEQRSPEEIANYRKQIQSALRQAVVRPSAEPGEPPARSVEALLAELDRWASLALLGAAEAVLRVDYLKRQDHLEPEDPVTMALQTVYADKGRRASLQDDILPAWRTAIEDVELSRALSDLKGSLLYRHWLAHGRYWRPNLARLYNFDDLYGLVSALLRELPLLPEVLGGV